MMKFQVLTLLLNFVLFPAEKNQDDRLVSEIEIIENVFSAYKDFKENNLESCHKKMSDIGLVVSKSTKSVIPKDIKIDTLIFEDKKTLNTIFIRSVDLDYLKNVNGFLILHSKDPAFLAERLVQHLMRSSLMSSVNHNIEDDSYTIKDHTSFIVYDHRWREEVATEFPSFYTCHIKVLGEYIDISFEEVVPKKYKILNSELLLSNNIAPGL